MAAYRDLLRKYYIPATSPPMTTAIVLGAGGTRAAFEVGALRYLYDIGIRPDLICGTSGGAINAVKLAEGEDPREPDSGGLAGLENLWLSLKTNSDMYRPQPWFENLPQRIKDELARVAIDYGIAAFGPSLSSIITSAVALGVDYSKLNEIAQSFLNAESLYSLDPIWTKLRDPRNLNPASVRMSGIRLRLCAVNLEVGAVFAQRSYTTRPAVRHAA